MEKIINFMKKLWISDGQNVQNDSHTLAFYYIKEHLCDRGYRWNDCPVLPRPSEQSLIIAYWGKKIESEHYEEFEEMNATLSSTPTYLEYSTIAKEIFKEEINWGKIFVLFAWSGFLATQLFKNDAPYMIVVLADYLANFVNTNLLSWMKSNSILKPPSILKKERNVSPLREKTVHFQ